MHMVYMVVWGIFECFSIKPKRDAYAINGKLVLKCRRSCGECVQLCQIIIKIMMINHKCKVSIVKMSGKMKSTPPTRASYSYTTNARSIDERKLTRKKMLDKLIRARSKNALTDF